MNKVTIPITEQNFMPPPDSSRCALELKESILQELETHKQCGKHRDWYENLLHKWFEQRPRNWKFDIMTACLLENPADNYTDADYINLAVGKYIGNELVSVLFLITNELLKRKLVVDRNLPPVKKLLSWNSRDFSGATVQDRVQDMEIFAAETILLTKAITLTGDITEDSAELHDWEKKLLRQPNLEVILRSIQSGFFLQKKTDDYLEYIAEKGAKELTPIFISLKYKNTRRNSNSGTEETCIQ